MRPLTGVEGKVGIGPSKYAGTNDDLFLGVYGPGGGREWNIAEMDEKVYKSGINYWFVIGDSDFGDPIRFNEIGLEIDLELVTGVYLRKSGAGEPGEDNALFIAWSSVRLEWNGPNPASKDFALATKGGPVGLSIARGLQVWLTDVTIPGIGKISRPF